MTISTQQLTGTFVADPVHSSFEFAVKHMKVATFRASFGDVDARVVADESGLRVEGTARVESISINHPAEFRQHVLHGADFFDGGNHPEITVRSQTVRVHDDGTLTAEGELTIKGVTKPVTATGTLAEPVEDPFGSVRSAVELTTTVDRRDWGMDWQMQMPGGGDVLSYDVTITARLELVKGA
ncbi:MAG: YceI family protein [Actinomycetota bacterium]|nr:YceI family protein [Actinomycetota bacterium]